MLESLAELIVPFRVRILPPFPDLEGGGLLPLCSERIVARVAAIPAKFVRAFHGEIEGVVVRAVYQNNSRAEDEQLRHLRLRRGLWREDDRLLPSRGRHPCESRAGVPGRSGDDDLGADLVSTSHNDGAGSVFERSRRVTRLVLQPQVLQAVFFCEGGQLEDGSSARRVQWSRIALRLVHRQERQIPPQRWVVARENIFGLIFGSDGLDIERHVQIAAVFRAGVGDLVGGIFRPAQRTAIAEEFWHGLIVTEIQNGLSGLKP